MKSPFTLQTLIGVLLTAVAVLVAGQWGMALGMPGIHFSPFWPLSAAAVASLLLGGWWMVPGIYIGLAASNALWDLEPLTTWVGPLGIIFEASFTVWLLRRVLGSRPRLTDLRGCFAFLLAPWLPVALNAFVATGLLHVEQVTTPDLLGREWALFVLANGWSIVLLVPAAVVWTGPREPGWWKMCAILAVITLGLTVVAFHQSFLLLPFVLFLPILAAALQRGLCCVAPLLAMVTIWGVTATRWGYGPFAAADPLAAFGPLYFFLGLLAVSGLTVAAATDRFRQRLHRARAAGTGRDGLTVWWWESGKGLGWDELTDLCPLSSDKFPALDPQDLFESASERGLRELEVDGRQLLSLWRITARDAEGQPLAAAGLLLESGGTLSVGETQRRAWESEIEVRNLRASLTPHLLFNCLAAVRGIVRSDPERARAFIDRLARFLRDSTNAQTRETIPLLDEWQLCEDFLALQSMRYERELPRLTEIEGAAYHAPLPPMILLNLVENAVKHGHVNQQAPLVVTARILDGFLEIEVRNHGQLGPQPTTRPGGLGTARARLAAVYGPSATLDMRTDGEQVVALVRIPVPAAAPAGNNA